MPGLRYDDQDDRATWADPHDIPAMCGLEHLRLEELERRFARELGLERDFGRSRRRRRHP